MFFSLWHHVRLDGYTIPVQALRTNALVGVGLPIFPGERLVRLHDPVARVSGFARLFDAWGLRLLVTVTVILIE